MTIPRMGKADYPEGWAPVSPAAPMALLRTYSRNVGEAAERGTTRYGFFGCYRGDALTPVVAFTPTLRRVAQYPRPQLNGDVRERK